MYIVNAKIYLKKREEGGMPKEGFSGMQPSFSVPGDLIMCRVVAGEKGTVLPLGEWHDVEIELPYGELFREHVQPGYEFKLQVGGQVIGHGTITSMRAPSPRS